MLCIGQMRHNTAASYIFGSLGAGPAGHLHKGHKQGHIWGTQSHVMRSPAYAWHLWTPHTGRLENGEGEVNYMEFYKSSL